MIYKQQAEVLAAILALIRPNDWRPNQTLKVLQEHWETPHPFAVIAEVAVRAANDPAIKSPTGIFLPGKHWQFETFNVVAPSAPKCPEHEWEDAHHCRACLADVAAGERAPEQVGRGRPKPRRRQPPPEGWRPTKPQPAPKLDACNPSPTAPASDPSRDATSPASSPRKPSTASTASNGTTGQ